MNLGKNRKGGKIIIRAENETFELVMLDDIPVLFTNSRVERESIPTGVYCYDVRHDDECSGIACEVKPFILVNHWGTIISKHEIPLEGGSYYPRDDMNYLGISMTLTEFESMSVDDLSKAASESLNEIQLKMQ